MTTPPPESKLATVRKLLALAENAATPHEAEVATAKAAKLMAEHGIDQAHLAAAGHITDGIDEMHIPITDPYARGKATLLAGIALALACRSVLHTLGKGVVGVTVFGHATNRERVEILYTSLLLQATTQLVRVRPPYWSDESVAAYRRSWLHGFAGEVTRRLAAAEQRAAADVTTTRPAGAPSTELVLADRRAAVDHAYAQRYPDLKQARGSKLSGTGGYDGAQAGRRADLTTGTNHLKGAPARRIGAS